MKNWSHSDKESPGSAMMKRIEREAREKRHRALDAFARAFLGETGFLPSECELVERIEGNSMVWFFRERGGE